MSGFYVMPLFHRSDQWVARWVDIERPAKTSIHGILPETWWHRPEARP
jgi:peptide/nickel transport system substrate-binding protein